MGNILVPLAVLVLLLLCGLVITALIAFFTSIGVNASALLLVLYV